MQIDTSNRGFVRLMILGVGAVIILVGTYILFTVEAPEDEMAAKALPINTDGGVDAYLTGDPELE